ncbi:MAG: Asp-tRNA(Asn)/Glu-tRNA(Gln) amidotransferase subunit GatA [Flavobacteriales bacterium]|nr:Asp-tRNA(Asn)/Glu-tRNA(Gln) amidotransferase subunit GatA [Flavobacteriales bacterium]
MNTYRSLNSIKNAIKAGETTCLNLVEFYIQNIENNKTLNAFAEVFTEEAIKNAKEIDAKIANGNAGKLAGMVIGIKDNICYKNHKSAAASKILEGFESLYSATVVERLLDEDAIIIGRLNCDEFAMGSANENTIYGATKNPLDNTKVTGGSSGGAASAVAANLCLATLGSDTGGSIRQPASFCGTIGFKPTYSRVSRFGLIAFASSFDQIGPITNTVEDAAIILEIIAGEDDFDSTVSTKKTDKYTYLLEDKSTKRIAYFPEFFENEGLDGEIKSTIESQIQTLKNNGHIVERVSFPYLNYLVPTYYVISTAEASSNLARFDGVHYGFRSSNANSPESTYTKTRTEGFGKEVQRRIMLGTFVLSAGYHDAYYTKAQKMRRLIQDKTNKILKDYDFILSPTTPHTAFNLGLEHKDPIVMYLEDIFTVLANLSGNPAISLPLARHSNGMPFGTQLMAKPFHEADLLAFSHNLINSL